MRPPRSTTLTALLALGLLTVGTPAAHAAPPPVRCGDTLTSDTRLTRTLRCTTSPGLTLAAGVSLDLGGHSLVGPGTGTGIVTDPQAPATLSNGVVRGWREGVLREDEENAGTAVVVEDVVFRGNVFALLSSFGADVDVRRSRFVDNEHAISTFYASATISDSTFLRNRFAASSNRLITIARSRFVDNEQTFTGSETRLRLTDSVVTGSRIVYDNYDGVGAFFEGNTFARNGIVIGSDFSLDADEILHNRFVDNDLAVSATTPKHLVGNTFVGNRVAVASDPDQITPGVPFVAMEGNTFRRNGDAVYLTHPASLKDTVAIGNTGYGIYAPLATDLGGNVAYRNGTEPQCTGVVCETRS